MKTSTKNVVITGVFGIVCAIVGIFGTKQYINTQQNQLQNQTQSQQQTQDQYVVVNINGQEVSYESKDVENLNSQISLLKSENDKLEEANKNLENQIKQVESIPQIDLYDYKLFVDGVEKPITNINSVIEYNSQTYLRSDIVSLFDNSIIIDKSNNKIIQGRNLGETFSLMKECPPYETSGVYSTDPFIIQGETYSNGFVIFSSDYRDILFNLKNNYSSLEFDIGHVDGSGDYACVISFYIDDEYIKTINKNPQDDITHESIPLNKGKILKMVVLTKQEPTASPMCAEYGLANMILVQ